MIQATARSCLHPPANRVLGELFTRFVRRYPTPKLLVVFRIQFIALFPALYQTSHVSNHLFEIGSIEFRVRFRGILCHGEPG